jgi:basic endochitinase B
LLFLGFQSSHSKKSIDCKQNHSKNSSKATYMKSKHIIVLLALFISTPFSSIAEVITEGQFNAMFPNRSVGNCGADQSHTIFTYANLVTAGNMFPDFADVGTLDDKKREMAAFLGQAAHETTGGGGDWCGGVSDPNSACFNWGFCFSEEVACKNNSCSQYTSPNSTYPASPGKFYHGRGAIQLSHNQNYGIASEAIFGNKMTLLNNPELVKTGDLSFKTSLFYWMDGTSTRPSPHRIITGQATGDSRANTYGGVTNSINGGLECGPGNSGKLNSQRDRVNFFKNFATDLGVTAKPSSYTGSDANYFYCSNQSNFAVSPWAGQDVDITIILDGQTRSSRAPLSSTVASSSSQLKSSVVSTSSKALSSSPLQISSENTPSSQGLSSSTLPASSMAPGICVGVPLWVAKSYEWVSEKEYVVHSGKLYSHRNWTGEISPDLNTAWTLEGTCAGGINPSSQASSSTTTVSIRLNQTSSLKLTSNQIEITSQLVGSSNLQVISINGHTLMSCHVRLNGSATSHTFSNEINSGTYFVSIRWPDSKTTVQKVVIP